MQNLQQREEIRRGDRVCREKLPIAGCAAFVLLMFRISDSAISKFAPHSIVHILRCWACLSFEGSIMLMALMTYMDARAERHARLSGEGALAQGAVDGPDAPRAGSPGVVGSSCFDVSRVQSRFVANNGSQTGEPAFGMGISKRYGFLLAVLRVWPAQVFPEGQQLSNPSASKIGCNWPSRDRTKQTNQE